jgi:hypothetical protein
MAEWLILLLLFPAIVVPAVLLVGFAGCDDSGDVFDPGPGADIPVIESAVAESLSAIVLIWQVYDLSSPYV